MELGQDLWPVTHDPTQSWRHKPTQGQSARKLKTGSNTGSDTLTRDAKTWGHILETFLKHFPKIFLR